MDFDELMKRGADNVPREWISRRKSSPEVVQRTLACSAKTEASQHNLIVEMIRRVQPGDELRKFDSPREAWMRMRGQRGYVVLRDGKPLFAIVTVVN